MIPGEYFLEAEPIDINVGRRTYRLAVTNRGDRPIQVGSHCHFFEVNRHLSFDRAAAYGMRLNIASGTAVRFEPGDTRRGPRRRSALRNDRGMMNIDRRIYADHYGPTTGDGIRLADTTLVIRI